MSLDIEARDRPFIIAEAGTCHAGNDTEFCFRRAMKYVRAAAEIRADAIKFQVFNDPTPETMFCWIDGDEERARRWRQSVLSFDDWMTIKDETEALGLTFLASVFEYETVGWLSDLGVAATKVASRAAGSLEAFESAPRPLLVSNGMYALPPRDDAVFLECEANYPSTAAWRGEYPGFSDHSGNPWRAIDAIQRGCKLIEVHFFLNAVQAGPDFFASLTVDELEIICKARDFYATFKEHT